MPVSQALQTEQAVQVMPAEKIASTARPVVAAESRADLKKESSQQGRDNSVSLSSPVVGVNGSRQEPVISGVVGQQAAVLPAVPIGQKEAPAGGSMFLQGSSAESSDATMQVRDRASDIYSLGSTHQPTLVKPTASIQMQMPVGMPPMHPGWQQAISERVIWAAGQQVQTATMQLDPPELGALQVKLQIFQDQVSVTFTSPNAGVRDAVEQSLPRLREMLAEQGMDLGESSVNDQSSDQGRQQRELLSDGSYSPSSEQEVVGLAEKGSVGLSLVDYYA